MASIRRLGARGVGRLAGMITGAHFLLHSKAPEADRAFFRDVLNFRTVDIGHGWLIFGLPPSEMAVHPLDGNSTKQQAEQKRADVELYLLCDDLAATMASLKAKNVECAGIDDAAWGSKTTIRLPSGAEIGLYQPKHQLAI